MASIATAYAVSPLAEGLAFGATVSGLTRAMLDEEPVRDSLRELWIEKGVLLFRGGESSQAMQVALSQVFGELEPHPFPESNEPDFPELVKIKFYPEDGSAYEVDGEVRGGWLPWHSDLIYTARINRGGILRPAQLPQSGGRTGFLDQIAAWDRLPDDLKQTIEGLHVVYAVDMNMARHRFGHPGPVRFVNLAQSGRRIARRMFTYPRVIHPMVFTQLETGRKVLNVSPGFAEGIFEMGGPEGDDLLREVIAHCTAPVGSYFHEWREGDMVLWDNWRVLHCAQGVTPDQTRVMQRTTIRGDYALGRELDATARADFDV